MLVYEYLDDDFLSLVRKQIPMQARRQILKASLHGLADLHDKDIVHLGDSHYPRVRHLSDLFQISSRTILW